MEWAKHKKGLPAGVRCLRCAKAMSQAYPLKAWETIIFECSVQPNFKQEVQDVLRRFDGAKERDFVHQEFSQRSWTGFAVEAKYNLFTPKQFASEFGVEAGKIGLAADVLVDCHGQKFSGHLVREDGPLQVRCFHSVFSDLGILLQEPSSQLREDQAVQFGSEYVDDARKTLPKDLARPADALTRAGITEIKERKAKEAEDRRIEQEQLATLVPNTASEAGQQRQGEPAAAPPEEESESSESENIGASALLPSAKQRASKGGHGGKSKGKGKKKAGKQKGRLPALDACSVASGSTRLSPRSKILEKAREWLEVLNLKEILEGTKALGQRIYVATTTLDSLKRTHAGEPLTIALEEHLELAKFAEDWGLEVTS